MQKGPVCCWMDMQRQQTLLWLPLTSNSCRSRWGLKPIFRVSCWRVRKDSSITKMNRTLMSEPRYLCDICLSLQPFQPHSWEQDCITTAQCQQSQVTNNGLVVERAQGRWGPDLDSSHQHHHHHHWTSQTAALLPPQIEETLELGLSF